MRITHLLIAIGAICGLIFLWKNFEKLPPSVINLMLFLVIAAAAAGLIFFLKKKLTEESRWN